MSLAFEERPQELATTKLNVAVESTHVIVKTALEGLLDTWGFSITPLARADILLQDLTTAGPLLPPAMTPSLALIGGGDLEAMKVLRLGHLGYVRSYCSARELRAAIEAVSKGEIWSERRVLAQFLREGSGVGLTPRETEVYELLIRGMSNDMIGNRLKVSVNTVKAHASHIYSKLEVRNRVELLRQQSGRSGGVEATS